MNYQMKLFVGYKDFKDIRNLVKYFGPLGKLLNSALLDIDSMS